MFKNILGITLMLCFLGSSAYAKEIRTPVPNSAMDSCVIAGGEFRESENYYACCTAPTACVVCEKGAGGSCQSVSASKMRGMMMPSAAGSVDNFTASPPTSSNLRDQIKQPQTTAPAKAVNSDKTPIVKPIKQYQQIKAPAAGKANSK